MPVYLNPKVWRVQTEEQIREAFRNFKARVAVAAAERDAKDLESSDHFKKTENGMLLSPRAWSILSSMMVTAEYHRSGVRLPLTDEDERLCHLKDMAEASGLEFAELC